MVTRVWKVYGAEGHRQRISFDESFVWDFTGSPYSDGVRIIECLNSDKTGTNEYSIVKITRDTAEECEKELHAQISDGLFENSRVGKIEEVI